MQNACQYFIGNHDFSSFRGAQCQAHSPIREVYAANITVAGGFIEYEVKANGFLHHMVRNMVGVLLAIGEGKQPVNWVKSLMAAKDRKRATVTAPPQGLYLTGVQYPDSFQMPKAPSCSIIP